MDLIHYSRQVTLRAELQLTHLAPSLIILEQLLLPYSFEAQSIELVIGIYSKVLGLNLQHLALVLLFLS